MSLPSFRIFQIFLLVFLAGIAASSFLNPPMTRILFFCLTILGIVFATVAWTDSRVRMIGLSVAVFGASLGYFYFSASPPQNSIAAYNGGSISFQAFIAEEPDVRADKINYTVQVRQLIKPEAKPTTGRVLVTTGRYPEYTYGDVLKVSGKLETPFETQEFSYKNYLAHQKIYSLVRFAKIEKLSSGAGSPIKYWLLDLKNRFARGLSHILPEPQNALLLGLLLGVKRSLPDQLLSAFKTTGVTHIIAISGFNISIITRILGDWLKRVFGRRVSLVVSALVVVGFVVLTGAQSSVVRAAIMGLLAISALNFGRASQATTTLLLAAAVMIVLSPQVLLFDVGFQLSFLATAGLIFLSEPIERKLWWVPEFFELRSTLAATLSAQIFVLPLLINYFDQLSVVSPLANILILPLIPWAMLCGFISGLLALIFTPLSYVVTWITWAFLSYIIFIIETLARIPFAAVNLGSIPVAWILSYYLSLTAFVFVISTRQRQAKIWSFYNPVSARKSYGLSQSQ